MGGNQEAIPSKNLCFHCGDEGHWARGCHLKDMACVRSCGGTMKLFWSHQQRSKGCRFMRCKNQPQCKAFVWVDSPEFEAHPKEQASTSNSTNVKVTFEEKGKKITIEGQVNDVVELMNKKLNM